MGTLKENGDLLGTQKLKKVPIRTRVPKWGPSGSCATHVKESGLYILEGPMRILQGSKSMNLHHMFV